MAENKDYKFVDHYEFDEELLKKAFAEARKIYKERGFMRKMGFGKAPAITTVDMARAWMSEGHPFTCDHSEEVCANALKVLEAGRKSGVPIFHTTTGYVPPRSCLSSPHPIRPLSGMRRRMRPRGNVPGIGLDV